VKEQSHKEEMSAAIRGDFQRLRDRGVSASLAPQDAPDPAPEPVASPNGGGAPPHEEQAPEPSAEDPVEAIPPRRSWLSRLAGR
jgi:hypothetical protein